MYVEESHEDMQLTGAEHMKLFYFFNLCCRRLIYIIMDHKLLNELQKLVWKWALPLEINRPDQSAHWLRTLQNGSTDTSQ